MDGHFSSFRLCISVQLLFSMRATVVAVDWEEITEAGERGQTLNFFVLIHYEA